jgi:hypothetical protein
MERPTGSENTSRTAKARNRRMKPPRLSSPAAQTVETPEKLPGAIQDNKGEGPQHRAEGPKTGGALHLHRTNPTPFREQTV